MDIQVQATSAKRRADPALPAVDAVDAPADTPQVVVEVTAAQTPQTERPMVTTSMQPREASRPAVVVATQPKAATRPGVVEATALATELAKVATAQARVQVEDASDPAVMRKAAAREAVATLWGTGVPAQEGATKVVVKGLPLRSLSGWWAPFSA